MFRIGTKIWTSLRTTDVSQNANVALTPGGQPNATGRPLLYYAW